MKKIMCIIGHPKRLTPVSSCNVYDFENDDEAIRIYRCKYCGDYVGGYTRFVKSKFKETHFDKVDMFD